MASSKRLSQPRLKGLTGGRARKPGRIERVLDGILMACDAPHRWHDPRLKESTLEQYGRILLQYERRPRRHLGPGLGTCSASEVEAWIEGLQPPLSQTAFECYRAAFRQWFRRRGDPAAVGKRKRRTEASREGSSPAPAGSAGPRRKRGVSARSGPHWRGWMQSLALSSLPCSAAAMALGHWCVALALVAPAVTGLVVATWPR